MTDKCTLSWDPTLWEKFIKFGGSVFLR